MKGSSLMILVAVFSIGACLAVVPRGYAQESLNVGYVDLDRIRKEFNAYQKTLEEIQSVRDKEQANLDELANTFDQKLRNFEMKDGLWPSEDDKNLEFEKLKKDWNLLNDTKAEKDRDLEMKSREKLAPLIDRIKTGIQEVSRQNGKHLVFKQRDLAYFDTRLDITDKVLNYLNQE